MTTFTHDTLSFSLNGEASHDRVVLFLRISQRESRVTFQGLPALITGGTCLGKPLHIWGSSIERWKDKPGIAGTMPKCWRKGCQQECVHSGEMIALSAHTIDEVRDKRCIDEGEERPRPVRAPRQGWLIGGLHVGHRISFAFFSEGLSVGWDCAPGEYPPCGTEWRPSMSGASGYKIVPREWPRRRYRRPAPEASPLAWLAGSAAPRPPPGGTEAP